MAGSISTAADELIAKLKQMATEYDSTLLAAAMTMQSAQLWRGLIAVKKETPDSATNIYGLALGDALDPMDKSPQIATIGETRTLQ